MRHNFATFLLGLFIKVTLCILTKLDRRSPVLYIFALILTQVSDDYFVVKYPPTRHGEYGYGNCTGDTLGNMNLGFSSRHGFHRLCIRHLAEGAQ